MTNKSMNMTYYKIIKISDTDMVTAEVRNSLGKRKGLKFFNLGFFSSKNLEKKCEEAHEWADKRIALCERQETQQSEALNDRLFFGFDLASEPDYSPEINTTTKGK